MCVCMCERRNKNGKWRGCGEECYNCVVCVCVCVVVCLVWNEEGDRLCAQHLTVLREAPGG
jgi:hypothetical protein